LTGADRCRSRAYSLRKSLEPVGSRALGAATVALLDLADDYDERIAAGPLIAGDSFRNTSIGARTLTIGAKATGTRRLPLLSRRELTELPKSGIGLDGVRLLRQRGLSLKAYVVGLVVLFVVVAVATTAYDRSQTGRDAREAATTDARFAAGLGALDINADIALTQKTVAQVAPD
jgi:hypothetical protein